MGVKYIVTHDDLNSLEVMSLADYGRKLEVPEFLVDEFCRCCLKRFEEKKTPPDIFKDLGEIVKQLSVNNVVAIVTGNTARNVKTFLVEHGLDGFVRAIFGVDSSGSKAEKISLARSQFAKAGEPVFMVGDSMSDIRAAKEASVKSIAVSWGHQSAEKLSHTEPDYLIHSPRGLMEVIENSH